MSVEAFIDTNVLLYAASGAVDEPRKHKLAWGLVNEGGFAISAQVLAEFYVNCRKKKMQISLSEIETSKWIERLCKVPVVPIDHQIVQNAIGHSNRYQISYWDAALVAAAEMVDAQTLYSEDLSHGQKYGSVTVINPFKAD